MNRLACAALTCFVAATLLRPTPAAAQPWMAFGQRLVPIEDDASGFGMALAIGDFDGDDFEDLVVGEPFASTSEFGSSGRISLYRGSPNGLLAPVRIPHDESGAEFGSALAAGDFDDDGLDELAVGLPGAGSAADVGEVQLFEWVGGDLVAAGTFSQDSSGVLGGAEEYDRFGAALAVGDFDDDGVEDLAIGVPGEDVGSTEAAGAVNVLYGVAQTGLGSTGNELFYQGNDGVAEASEADDEFGRALAAGDFDCDGNDDLAIGIPGEAWMDEEDAGIVLVLGGGTDGLDPAIQNAVRYADYFSNAVEGGDRFGRALAAGRILIAGESCDDLVIGVPGDSDTGSDGAGAVAYYSKAFPAASYWTEDELDETSSVGDSMGRAFALGDFDGDGWDEPAIGVPRQDGFSDDVGRVLLLVRQGNGFSDEPLRFACRPGLPQCGAGGGESDEFGAALAAGDFDGDGLDDLAIGAPGRSLGGNPNAGAVWVLYSALFADDFESSDFAEWSNF